MPVVHPAYIPVDVTRHAQMSKLEGLLRTAPRSEREAPAVALAQRICGTDVGTGFCILPAQGFEVFSGRPRKGRRAVIDATGFDHLPPHRKTHFLPTFAHINECEMRGGPVQFGLFELLNANKDRFYLLLHFQGFSLAIPNHSGTKKAARKGRDPIEAGAFHDRLETCVILPWNTRDHHGRLQTTKALNEIWPVLSEIVREHANHADILEDIHLAAFAPSVMHSDLTRAAA